MQPGPESESDVIAATRKNNTRGKVLTASMVGTTIEFFDFYAYATASSLVFPALFFPNQTSTTQLLSSFAIFGVAFVARPLGSIIFGHFGDRIGRKKTLIASLLIMGIGTFLIGLLPTASTPGWVVLAPLLLVLLRFCQGVGLGGEWSGAALLATENAPKGKRAIWGTFPQLGAPVGFIIANLLFVGLNKWTSPEAFLAWGWRIPFLLSALLVAVGLYVRMSLMETPAFQLVSQKQQISKAPLATVFKTSWKPLILGTFIMFATYVIFYFMTAFTLTYGTSPATTDQAKTAAEAAGTSFDPAGFVAGLGYTKSEFLTYLIIGVVFFGIFTVVSGP
ncbi:MAG: MFS transporter, partial [Brevibacterium aurantiacum]